MDSAVAADHAAGLSRGLAVLGGPKPVPAGLEPLFLCFAPFAFFIRLSNRQTTALALTVLFWVFILYLRLNVSKSCLRSGGGRADGGQRFGRFFCRSIST